jgi:tetratricopeptide (TPR) repeat protein
VLQAWEQWDAAHQASARAQKLAPRVFDWHYLDAVVLQRLASHDEAAQRLKDALAASPGYLPAREKLADALFETGDLEESRRLFELLAREPAGEPIGHFALGRIAARDDRHAEAIPHLQRAIALFPEFGAAYYALALPIARWTPRRSARCARAAREMRGRWPGLEDPVLGTVAAIRDDAAAVLRRGLKLADTGDLAGAIALHEAALARDPSFAQAHGNLISLYGRTGNWVKAEEHYRAFVASGIDLGDAHYDYGVLLGLQEKWELAADAYRQAIAVNPRDARAFNNLGQVLERQRQLEAALAAYRQAVDSQPTFRLARFNLGRMLLALGRPAEAIVELEKLTEPRDSEAPRYLFALATAHVRAGHRDEGVKWATDAKQLAVEHGQLELAAAIERDLARLK